MRVGEFFRFHVEKILLLQHFLNYVEYSDGFCCEFYHIILIHTFTYSTACPSPFMEISGAGVKCIWISPQTTTKTWENAKQHCEDMGSYLITFNSKQSSRAFGDFLKQPGQPACEYYVFLTLLYIYVRIVRAMCYQTPTPLICTQSVGLKKDDFQNLELSFH